MGGGGGILNSMNQSNIGDVSVTVHQVMTSELQNFMKSKKDIYEILLIEGNNLSTNA